MADTKTDFRLFTPDGFSAPPENAVEALKQARAVLAEEGRWIEGEWFHNEHPEVDPEDPFCNSWAVCAEGAVGIVTCGVEPDVKGSIWGFDDGLHRVNMERRRIYNDALELLVRGANELLAEGFEPEPCSCDYDPDHEHGDDCCNNCCTVNVEDHSVYCDSLDEPTEVYNAHEYNDGGHIHGRADVLVWFDRSIAIGEREAA